MWRFLAWFAVLCYSQLAWADLPVLRGPIGDRKQSALIEQGRQALLRNDGAAATAAFEDAYRYMPRPVLLYLLGRAALLEKRQRAAIDLYRRYIEQMGEDVEPEIKAEQSQLLSNPLPVGAELLVVGVAGGFVSVDGRLVGALPLGTAIQLEPGSHQIELIKENRRVSSQVTLAPRRTAEIRFTLKPPLAVTTLTPAVLLFVEPVTLDPAFSNTVRKHVSEAVTQQRAVLVSPEQQATLLSGDRDLFSCLDQASCQEQLGQKSQAQYVLRLSFEQGAAALSVPELQTRPHQKPVTAYRYSATVLDVEVGAHAASATDSCVESQCSKLMGRIADMTQDLLKTAANKPRGTLHFGSEPAGADVLLDGHKVAVTPGKRDAFIGQHELQFQKPGYHPFVTSVLVEDNKELPVSALLTPMPLVTSSRTRSILKWTTLGIGLLATAGGATLLGLNGRPMACASDASQTCPFDGRAGGAALLTIGTLSLGGSLALFILDTRQNSGSQVLAAPGRAGLSLTGSN